MDKFRQTFPIAVTFTEGELPTAAKLQGLATQARSGQGIIQYALGDLWNQAGDNILSATTGLQDNALMIPNIARYLGATKHVSPRIPYLPNIESFTYTFTADDNGKYETKLPFPPDTTVAGYPTGAFTHNVGSSLSGDPQTAITTVNATGRWYIDTDTGYIFSYDAFSTGDTIEYQPVVAGDIGETTTWNVIPDPNTDTSWAFFGLKIEYKHATNNSEGYYIYLPPRMPLYAAGDADKPAWYPEPSTDNMAADPTAGPALLMWQLESATAPDNANADHYRYLLPDAITGSSEWSSANQLPSGMLYLWDSQNSGTILEGVTFYAETAATPSKWKLYVPYGTALDTYLATSYGAAAYTSTILQTKTHEPANYPSGGLKLITVGSDLSKAFGSLLQQYLNHDHSTSHSIASQPVSHNKLTGLKYTGGTQVLHASGWTGDDHPHYLERHGYSTTRDKYGNGLLGDLLLNSTNSTNSYINSDGESNKIGFGQVTSVVDGSQIWQDFSGSTNFLNIHSKNLDNKIGTIQFFDTAATSNYLLMNTYDADHATVALRSVFGMTKKGSGKFQLSVDDASSSIDVFTASPYSTSPADAPSAKDILLRAGDSVELYASDDVTATATDDIALTAGDDITITATTGVVTVDSEGLLTLDSNGGNVYVRSLGSAGRVYVENLTEGGAVILKAGNSLSAAITDYDNDIELSAENEIALNAAGIRFSVMPARETNITRTIACPLNIISQVSDHPWGQSGDGSRYWEHGDHDSNKSSVWAYCDGFPSNASFTSMSFKSFLSTANDRYWVLIYACEADGTVTLIGGALDSYLENTVAATHTIAIADSVTRDKVIGINIQHADDGASTYAGAGNATGTFYINQVVEFELVFSEVSSYAGASL